MFFGLYFCAIPMVLCIEKAKAYEVLDNINDWDLDIFGP